MTKGDIESSEGSINIFLGWLSIASTSLAVCLATVQIMKHLLYYNEPRLQIFIVRILLMIPVLLLSSLGLLHHLDSCSIPALLLALLTPQHYPRLVSHKLYLATRLTCCTSSCSCLFSIWGVKTCWSPIWSSSAESNILGPSRTWPQSLLINAS